MNKGIEEVRYFLEEFERRGKVFSPVETGIAPPFPFILLLKETLSKFEWKTGAQNCFYEREGAYTGEVSPYMLKSAGVDFVILGHSERRTIFGESNEVISKKIKSALKEGIEVVLCVGEKIEERREGRAMEVVGKMMDACLQGVERGELINKITIAYEPVWAIGTGINAKPEEIKEMHSFIRKIIDGMFGKGTGDKITIQYGGSVNPENIGELAQVEEVDGFLVGGASLKVNSFFDIIETVRSIRSG